MLLDLYVQESGGRRVSVTSACMGSCSPSTTALRHLSSLIDAGYAVREAHSHDGRVSFVRLTRAGVETVEQLLGAMR